MNPGNAWSAYAANADSTTTVWPTAAPPEGTEQSEGTTEQPPANSSMVSQKTKKTKPRLNFI